MPGSTHVSSTRCAMSKDVPGVLLLIESARLHNTGPPSKAMPYKKMAGPAEGAAAVTFEYQNQTFFNVITQLLLHFTVSVSHD